jgi:hypothetical protein
MRGRFLLSFFIVLINYLPPGFSQGTGTGIITGKAVADTIKSGLLIQDDSIKRPDIVLSRDQAIKLLQKSYRLQLWKNKKNPFRSAIGRLVYIAANPPFDSTKNFFKGFNYDSIDISRKDFVLEEQVRFKVPEDSLIKSDTNFYSNKMDTVVFYKYSGRNDSIKAAVGVLLDYLEARDSSIISFSGINNKDYQFWLNSKSDKVMRFWLKNDLDDSVTVWIGNPARNTICLYLEHGVSFRRPSRQGNVSQARINVEPQDNSRLVDIKKILTKFQLWRYRTEASFALNQGLVTNWVKGGENSVSTALDITWYADYNNKPMLLSSNHFARIKYGLIKSGDDGIRKNIDLLETNSKLNHKAFGKFDFSGIMLFKTQVSKGYNYPNDSIPVSKFMNPAILTLGFGLDYKPDKYTSINFSPLSYKATFVPDTANIDQTKYGVAANRRSKHEPGASFMITNEFRPLKSMVVTNRLQLFTNYIYNPLNIDVDWEMILQANINWFTDVRLNTHLIFDDDTKTPVFDKDKNPVMGNDGVQKKTARIQFKELLGLSFIFRF